MWDTNRDSVIFLVTFTLILAVSSFVFWGPSTRRKRKGHILGLENLGYTCFLNALLQSLASCSVVLDWLTKQHINSKKESLTNSLQRSLQVVNGKEEVEDPYTPSELIQTLLAKGWVIQPGEQDAHELFHVMVTTLEEETQVPSTKGCSLLDALDVEIDPREVQSDISHLQNHPQPLRLKATVSCLETRNLQLDDRFKTPLPFHGLFTSQLQCLQCKYKSAVHYDTFYSLSLVLPPRSITVNIIQFYTLQELINNYVTNRVVHSVSCDGCKCPETDQIKSLNFGKLPPCLCIHIARTTWEGEARKRDDYIEFPEYLNMEPYTYASVQLKQCTYNKLATGDVKASNGSISLGGNRYKHCYQLMAVMVHKGGVFNGHFITYRRGVGNTQNNWFYTSDTEVREVNIHEVMQASAYMLFYIKLTGTSFLEFF